MTKAGMVNTENYWDTRFAEDWESNAGEAQSVFFGKIALEMLPEWFQDQFSRGKLSLCDWGCAEGDGTNILATHYPKNKIVGIDFADTAIQKAQAKFPKVNFRAVDLLTEKYTDRYDVVFTSNVLEHFHDPWNTFRKVATYAEKFFVIMVPFDEDPKARIPEHFASFSLDTVPVEIDDWTLVHFSVKNTESIKGTYWAGKQSLMIFAKPGIMHDLKLRAADVTMYSQEVESQNEQIRKLLAGIDDREEQIKMLKSELRENWLQLNSHRYRAANTVANVAGVILPSNSIRRKIATAPIKGVRHTMRLPEIMQEVRFNQELRRLAKKHESVIVHSGMPWDAVMRQRPHHLAEQLAALGYLMVYIDPDATQSYKISDDLLIVKGYKCLEVLSPLHTHTDLYYLSSAGFPTSFAELRSIVDSGFGLVYEYIDELDELISGDLTRQIEVFKRLEELNPVLLLASAKRLYGQLAQRFPKERLLLNENAVDNKQFAPTKRAANNVPADMRDIIAKGKPIVGYYGALAPWLDYDLINTMTATRKDYEFVFVGLDYNHGLQHLMERPNVHYLGPKDYNRLADYSYWFDCALIPFETGEIAKSTSPLKLFEYMAMGLPTVCTRDLRECSGYDGVLMSPNAKAFIANVDKAIKLKQSQEARDILMGYAKKNTWKVRAKDIAETLQKLKAAER